MAMQFPKGKFISLVKVGEKGQQRSCYDWGQVAELRQQHSVPGAERQ